MVITLSPFFLVEAEKSHAVIIIHQYLPYVKSFFVAA